MSTPKATVFEETYKKYLEQIAETDFAAKEEILGVKKDGNELIIPLFGRPYRVSGKGIADNSEKQPDLSVCVVLSRYILMCPDKILEQGDWSAFRDFKDAGPLTVSYDDNIEKPIARKFSGRLGELDEVCRKIGGISPDMDLSYDFKMRFDALPRVPLLLLFNDADDDFPAKCSVLFEKNADKYLDAESLAIVGGILCASLK
ncbi:MAG: DUF3786 domain-containing protein [Desulfobacterales bacterium]|nr:DUF3786 domain-containing protein [Desulfobacterales bacterium]